MEEMVIPCVAPQAFWEEGREVTQGRCVGTDLFRAQGVDVATHVWPDCFADLISKSGDKVKVLTFHGSSHTM